jgi:hypothetical protein
MFLKRLRLTLEMIRFEHSVFALPFALTGALLAFREGGNFTGWRTRKSMPEIPVRAHGIFPPGSCRAVSAGVSRSPPWLCFFSPPGS